jgi:15-cis-phytoene desaturase
MRSEVTVIGGGLAGLSCAVALADSGLKVRVFEGAARLGGRACSWTDGHSGDVVDLGPHILLTEYRNMLALLALLGTRDRIVWETRRLIRLREGRQVTDMRLHALPAPFHLVPSFARAKSVGWADLSSNRRVLWMAMRLTEAEIKRLDDRTALELLRYCGVTRKFIDWFWASACMSVLNVPLEECSAGALMRVFAQLCGLQEYAIGFADVGLAELFVPAAVRRIEQRGGQVHTGASVDRILVNSGHVHAIALKSGERFDTRMCVAAVPPRSLTELLPGEWLRRLPFTNLSSFEPSPYISSYLWFDRKISREKFWARIWEPSGLNTDFYDLSNIRKGWSERNESVIASNIIYSHRAAALTDEQIIAATVDEIRDAFPEVERGSVRHALINRIPMAIPCPVPGSELRRPAAQTPIDGLMLAGDWTDTCLPASMESAVHSGWAAAEAILRIRGSPRELVMPKRAPEGIAGLIHRYAAH